jgi:hypothetical protein
MAGLEDMIGAHNEKADVLRQNMWISQQEIKAKMKINKKNMEAGAAKKNVGCDNLHPDRAGRNHDGRRPGVSRLTDTAPPRTQWKDRANTVAPTSCYVPRPQDPRNPGRGIGNEDPSRHHEGKTRNQESRSHSRFPQGT